MEAKTLLLHWTVLLSFLTNSSSSFVNNNKQSTRDDTAWGRQWRKTAKSSFINWQYQVGNSRRPVHNGNTQGIGISSTVGG